MLPAVLPAVLPAMLLLSLEGCRKKETPVAVIIDPPVVTTPSPAGRVVDGVFYDDSHGLQAPIPEGWIARPGLDTSPIRLTLTAPDGATMELWLPPPGNLPDSPGCHWNFHDAGPYGSYAAPAIPPDRPATPPASLARTVADCTPDDPRAPLREAACMTTANRWICVISALPPGTLARHRRAGMAFLEGVGEKK